MNSIQAAFIHGYMDKTAIAPGPPPGMSKRQFWKQRARQAFKEWKAREGFLGTRMRPHQRASWNAYARQAQEQAARDWDVMTNPGKAQATATAINKRRQAPPAQPAKPAQEQPAAALTDEAWGSLQPKQQRSWLGSNRARADAIRNPASVDAGSELEQLAKLRAANRARSNRSIGAASRTAERNARGGEPGLGSMLRGMLGSAFSRKRKPAGVTPAQQARMAQQDRQMQENKDLFAQAR